MMLIGIAIIFILVLISYIFGQKIAKPLAILDTATQKIGKDDFKYRIDMKQNDEFGNLAISFNSMAKSLQHSTTSIAILEKEVAARRKAEKEQEKLIKELQESLENVKTLSGLLPICAKCKKIRNDEGYWDSLEEYIQTHSNILFSHSLCSKCSDALYGNEDWYMEMKKDDLK
ncbi:putative two component system sensor histidine kinase [Desulfobacula toluolica Tol2]|uniref:histidine kinase n=2 Tax=Desulfobacula TaxID=28222 RepID=K0NI80_DESTT|nr:putative two component system sensor histidine kinase [Desulfobacula toluolica Tol2]